MVFKKVESINKSTRRQKWIVTKATFISPRFRHDYNLLYFRCQNDKDSPNEDFGLNLKKI